MGQPAAVAEEWFYRFDDAYDIDSKPILLRFKVLRRTPKGVMIHEYGREKFVLAGVNGKRYAYPTGKDALHSYIARKRRAIKILTHNLNKQHAMLDCALGGKLEKDEFLQFTG